MESALATQLETKIRGLLLLQKLDQVNPNILAMLGMFSSDITNNHPLQIMFDADEITILSKPLPDVCTCDKADPKVTKVDRGLHTERCNRVLRQKLLAHANLIRVDEDETETTWTFQWPRDITGYRNILETRFKELSDKDMWSSFQKSWAQITNMMPDPEPSLSEQEQENQPLTDTQIEEGAEEIIAQVSTPPDPEEPVGMDFDTDMDFSDNLDDLMPPPTKPIIAFQTSHNTEISVVHGAGNPAVEAAAQAVLDTQEVKRGRGRPKGTTNLAKARAQELTAGDFEPTQAQDGKKVFPACLKFGQFASEELSRLCTVLQQIIVPDDGFPLETIESFKNSLDRLALRAAHLQFKGRQDQDEPTLDGIVEVTLMNVTASANVAVRDLGLSPEKPESWQKYQKDMKEVIGKADSMFDIMSQSGMGPIISGK